MKLISVLAVAALLASSLATPAFAGLLDGQPADPVKRARPGGYNEQVANLKSLASCVANIAVKDQWGNIIHYRCH